MIKRIIFPIFTRASNYMGLERYKEALDVLNECVEKEPRLEGAYLLISYCGYALNEDVEGPQSVDKALAQYYAKLYKKTEDVK